MKATITITIEETFANVSIQRPDGFVLSKTIDLSEPADARRCAEIVEGFAPDVREALEEVEQPSTRMDF